MFCYTLEVRFLYKLTFIFIMLRFTWDQIAEAIDELGKKIIASGYEPDYLIGITLGGLVPLMLLGKQMKNRNVLTIGAQSYDKDQKRELQIMHLPDVDLSGKKILLIDEIADTGDTLLAITNILKEKYDVGGLKTAVVVCKDHSVIKPDFSVRSTQEWVVFPWEKAETPELFEGQ